MGGLGGGFGRVGGTGGGVWLGLGAEPGAGLGRRAEQGAGLGGVGSVLVPALHGRWGEGDGDLVRRFGGSGPVRFGLRFGFAGEKAEQAEVGGAVWASSWSDRTGVRLRVGVRLEVPGPALMHQHHHQPERPGCCPLGEGMGHFLCAALSLPVRFRSW